MEDFLTVKELSEHIKFSRQTLYNLIYKKKFIKGKHYVKPSPKKVLFKWSEIEKWLEDSSEEISTTGTTEKKGIAYTEKNNVMKTHNLIKI